MARYKYILYFGNGDQLDSESHGEVFNSYEDAQDAALKAIGNYRLGGEMLNLSNPGDYEYDEDENIDYDIVEID